MDNVVVVYFLAEQFVDAPSNMCNVGRIESPVGFYISDHYERYR